MVARVFCIARRDVNKEAATDTMRTNQIKGLELAGQRGVVTVELRAQHRVAELRAPSMMRGANDAETQTTLALR